MYHKLQEQGFEPLNFHFEVQVPIHCTNTFLYIKFIKHKIIKIKNFSLKLN